jgi:hypothetical protein
MPVKDINHLPQFEKMLKELVSKKIYVGVFKEDDAELSKILSVHEYGATIPVSDSMRRYMAAVGFPLKKSTTVLRIPERAPLRKSMEHTEEIENIIQTAVSKAAENYDSKKAMNYIGRSMVRLVQKVINSNLEPALHPMTIREKGSSVSLIGKTKKLVNGIVYKIK